MEKIKLVSEWARLLLSSNVTTSTTSDLFFDKVCTAYSEAHRHYHTLDHLQHMLSLLRAAGVESPEAGWSTFYHDIIYKPGKSNNEEKSAVMASRHLSELGVDNEVIKRVVMIIQATKNHQVEDLSDDMVWSVLDADMAILGASEESYDLYRQSVRREFRLYPNLIYNRGRTKFLKATLCQKSIFKTPWFYERFEAKAKANLEREIGLLNKSFSNK